jgi:poly(3-hydroxybutyrate) depolymerase
MMAYRLGCEPADRLVAIAPVAGNIADEHGSVEIGRRPARPVALLVVHGLADRSVPIEEGPSPDYPNQVAYASLSDVLRLVDASTCVVDAARLGALIHQYDRKAASPNPDFLHPTPSSANDGPIASKARRSWSRALGPIPSSW